VTGTGFGIAPQSGSWKIGMNSQVGTPYDALSFDLSSSIVGGSSYDLQLFLTGESLLTLGPLEVGISTSATSFGSLVYSATPTGIAASPSRNPRRGCSSPSASPSWFGDHRRDVATQIPQPSKHHARADTPYRRHRRAREGMRWSPASRTSALDSKGPNLVRECPRKVAGCATHPWLSIRRG
jgi:hypothetical protein